MKASERRLYSEVVARTIAAIHSDRNVLASFHVASRQGSSIEAMEYIATYASQMGELAVKNLGRVEQ